MPGFLIHDKIPQNVRTFVPSIYRLKKRRGNSYPKIAPACYFQVPPCSKKGWNFKCGQIEVGLIYVNGCSFRYSRRGGMRRTFLFRKAASKQRHVAQKEKN